MTVIVLKKLVIEYLRVVKFESKFPLLSSMWEFLVEWNHPHGFHVLLSSGIKLAAFSLSFCFLPSREQPIFSTRAHVFQIDPNTKKNWVPTSKHAVTVSYFYDSTRNVYRIISLDGSKVSYIYFQLSCRFALYSKHWSFIQRIFFSSWKQHTFFWVLKTF